MISGSKWDTRIFESLLEEAENSADLVGNSRHSACLVYRNRIIAKGTNRLKTHPLCKTLQSNPARVYLHAEMDVIIRCMNKYGDEILKECDLYVLRLTKGNKIGYSKPCPACTKLLEVVGIKRFYYS